MNKFIVIQKAENKKLIVQQDGKKPRIYEGLSSLISNEFFYEEISNHFNSDKIESMEISFSIEINPPKSESAQNI